MRRLEVCADSFAAAQAAVHCGADRLELCGDLTLGGLTPDPGLLDRVMTELTVPVQVMIRPRGGGFIYTPDELDTMAASIRAIRRAWPGITGFVTGALLPEGLLDRRALERLQEAAGPVPLTLHRAFDRTLDLSAALESCITLGIERVLTSGGADTVDAGLDSLAALNRQAGNRIVILPGGGVRPDNARLILTATGVQELHLSGRQALSLGPLPDDRTYVLDPAVITAVRELLDTV